ncbi:MAG: NAD(P)/FAD-dependent oxidoreductase, partial [Acutalibacteraceae bacterium]|nr:NAD(P)/FAD-dependent oxidoreductase [Acutalibacteraceae bacterium]
MKKVYDVIVIGGGPGGYTAALYAARAGLDTLVIEKLSVGGQMALTDTIDNYPGFEEGIDGISLGFKMQQGAEKFGVKTEYDEVVSVSLDGKVKTITGASGEYRSKTVIIATGAGPRELGIEKEKELTGKGVHYCA